MKKLVCIILALFMVFGLAACSSSGETAATQSASAEATVAETASTEASSSAEASASAETAAYTGEEMTIVFATADTETSVEGQGFALFKDLVEETTDGKVQIEVYFNSTLLEMDQEIPALMKGTIGMTDQGATDYATWLGMVESCYFFKNTEDMKNFYYSDIAERLYEEFAQEYGIRFLGVYGNGRRTVNINEDKKVTCRADLANVKMRFPNTESALFWGESLGANPVPLGFSDVYLSLQTGAIDGQDNAVSLIRANSFYEVTKSVTITGHIVSRNTIFINDALYQSMSPELQKIISDSVREACDWITDTSLANEADDIAFLEEQGLKVYQLTDEELKAYSEEVKAYYFESEAGKTLTADWDMDLYGEIQAMFD